MRIAVLGAGIVGLTTAYQLVRRGHEVTIIDRQPGPALECSHANGGYIAISQAVPWSAPGVPTKTLLSMLRPDAPILLHAGQLPRMWTLGPRIPARQPGRDLLAQHRRHCCGWRSTASSS